MHIKSHSRNSITNILFLLPALILFTAVVYYPLVSSFQYSVTDWGMTNKEYNYIGFDNFIKIIGDDYVRAGFKNTFVFALYTTFIGNLMALLLALILDRKLKTRNLLRIVFYIPCLLSPIIVAGVFGDIFQQRGIINEILKLIGLESMVQDWFGSMRFAMPMLIIVNAWQFLGYGSVIYLAGLQTIPTEYYEAASIDGAGKAKIFFKITFPLLMPSVTIMSFMSLTGGLKFFDIPFVLTRGGPGNATETMGTVIYKLAFNNEQFGFATAVAVVFFIIIAILTAAQLTLTRSREVQL